MLDANLKVLIDDIKRLMPLEDYVGGFLTRGKASGDNIFFNSPWASDSTPSFSVSKSKQIWNDFTGIGGPRLTKDGKSVSSGDLIGFAMQIHDVSFYEAVSLLAEEVGLDMSQYPEVKLNQSNKVVPLYDEEQLRILEINKQAQMFFEYNFSAIKDINQELSKAEHYAKQVRGFSSETIKEFQLGYAHNDYKALFNFLHKKGYLEEGDVATGLVSVKDNGTFDVFNNRLMVPVIDHAGNVLGWGGRGLEGSDYKYLNSSLTPVFEKNKILFRLDQARPEIRRNGCVMLMEGFLDVVSAWQYGFKNVVASMGTSFTNQHLDSLSKISDTVILAFDGDSAGIKATLNVFNEFHTLSKKTLVKAILIPDGLDPDEFLIKYGADAFNELIQQAMPYLDFKLKINQNILSKPMDELSLFKKEFFGDLAKYRLEPTELRMYLAKLSSMLNVDLPVLIDDFSNHFPDKSLIKSPPLNASPNPSSTPLPSPNELFSFDNLVEKESLPEHSLKIYNFSQVRSMDDVKKVVYKHLTNIFNKDNQQAFSRILEWKIKNPSMDMLECSWCDYFLQDQVKPSKLLDFRIVANLMDYLDVKLDNEDIFRVIGTMGDKSKGIPLYFVNRNDPNTLRRSTYLWASSLKINNHSGLDALTEVLQELIKQKADSRLSFVELPYLTRLIFNSLPLFKTGELIDSLRSYSEKKKISINSNSLILDDFSTFSKTLSKRFNQTKNAQMDLFYETVLNNTLSCMVNKDHTFTINPKTLNDSFSYFKKNFNDLEKNFIVSSKTMDMGIFEFLYTHLSRIHKLHSPKRETFIPFQNQQEEIAR